MKKLIIITAVLFIALSASAQTDTNHRHMHRDTCIDCRAKLDSARAQSGRIKIWMKDDMTLDEATRWLRRKQTMILPHVGVYRIIKDTAWKIH